MKKRIIGFLILMFFLSVLSVSATEPLPDIFIKYKAVGWQTYEFYVATSSDEPQKLRYEWTVDNRESYGTADLWYFFPKGEHLVKVKVHDEYGNIKYDSVRLNVNFWSLKNNWFWWTMYLFVVILVVYYWLVKILYLFNRRRVSREARRFLDVLDEHGWVEKIILNKTEQARPLRSRAEGGRER